ncbi:MAG: HAMP domain-containing histidine kinase [Propionibacteriaceae bacterium]|nr:HAMP domain-containing histidine kinase [Propionibacteriaceae bacterium]
MLRPVRAAAVAAERLAGGNLEERLPVKGSSDLASLATSMNFMAAELDLKITELEKISQVQQQFVSDVSHELKTPLTTIQMATSMIDAHRAELEPVAERSAELLSKEVGRFSDLLADLLEVSRFDAGAASLSLDDVDLGKLVSAEVDGVLPLANRAGAEITVAASGEFTAELDRTRVRRILRNLLTNAIEHGEGKPIEVDVGGNDDAVAVTVRDHGVGLDPQQVQQVFTRFWRGDPSRSRQLGGVGLGLAIALEDAKLHGGKLGVWAALEQGACFRLVLPRHPGGEIVPEPLELAPEGEGGSVHEP